MKKYYPLGLGVLHFGSLLDKATASKIVAKAIDYGVNFFDTAPLYGQGKSEEILGDILSSLPKSIHTFVATKVGLKQTRRKDNQFGVEVYALNEKNIRTSVEESLKKLKRDHIDLLMLHAFDDKTCLSETMDVLQMMLREGKVLSFGCSNYNPQQLKTLVVELKKRPSFPFIAAQCHYNMIERRAEQKFMGICIKNNFRIIVNRALARGALSEKYSIDGNLPEGSRGSLSPRIQKWLTFERLELLEGLRKVALKNGLSLSQMALGWIFSHHQNALVLVGVRNIRQLEDNVRSLTNPLKSEVLGEIECVIQGKCNVYNSPPRFFEK